MKMILYKTSSLLCVCFLTLKVYSFGHILETCLSALADVSVCVK